MGTADSRHDEPAATPPRTPTLPARERSTRVVISLLVLVAALLFWQVSVKVAALSNPRPEYRTDFDHTGEHHFVATEIPPGKLTEEQEDALQDAHLGKLDRYKAKLDARAARRKEAPR